MLFNSHEFLFIFLPLTLLVFFSLSKLKNHNLHVGFLIFASLFFYAWWNPTYLTLLLSSILVNFSIGKLIIKSATKKKLFLYIGVSLNLLSIFYFKYFLFFLDTLQQVTSGGFQVAPIILPLAISFFTFQQIMYLVDLYKNEIKDSPFLDYCLFVTFFPQLIAGPIVSYREISPQLRGNSFAHPLTENLVIGLTIFSIGLFKKVFLADGIASFATPVFQSAAAGNIPNFFEAWGGTLAYSFQLYFDFSGYSDMAIGIGLMFGIRLPINFFSPYKAKSIIEFWKRWHITLSRFLMNYLYIPLGGNRGSTPRWYKNLMITMLLGGIWHGAGWTFVIWGGLHGVFLIINHLWRKYAQNFRWIESFNSSPIPQFLTLLAVAFGWIFFRADNLDTAILILKGTVGIHNIHLPIQFRDYLPFLDGLVDFNRQSLGSFPSYKGFFYLTACFVITLKLPSIAEIFPNLLFPTKIIKENKKNNLVRFLRWTPQRKWLILTSLLIAFSILNLARKHEFIYFQF